jgi:hypothetical protein
MSLRDRSAAAAPNAVTVNTCDDLATLLSGTKTPGSIRVRGAMHSVRDSIVPDSATPTTVLLGTEFQAIDFDTASFPLVNVGAGLRLGGDPDEGVPASVGMLNWLATRLQGQGYSVPDLGGITHQSVGGFLSTGSSGGSLTSSLDDAIVGIQFMDGRGQVHDVTPADGDLWNAIGVSMGLLGVITQVTIKPVGRFAIKGTESTFTIGASGAPFQPFAAGPTGLEQYLRAQDYCRVMWWPQTGVNKMVSWTATAIPIPPKFKPIPYQEIGDPDEDPKAGFPPEIETTLLPRLVDAVLDNLLPIAALLFEHRDELPDDFYEFIERTINTIITEKGEGLKRIWAQASSSEVQQFGVDLYFSLLGNRVTNPLAKSIFAALFTDEATFEGTWSPLIMNGVFLIDDADKVVPGPQQFIDYADLGLPMDNQISDRLMPTEFTELWIPIDQTVPVMQALAKLYANGYPATGTYACELYATKASPFWMSPAYGGDVIRVDVFWFGRNGDQTPQSFYQQFWDALRPFGFRPHWGKYLPPPASYGKTYYQGVYPHLGDFLDLRATYDPDQIFVTDYWRQQLGIAKPS